MKWHWPWWQPPKPSPSYLGRVVIAGYTFPIEKQWLAGGKLHVQFSIPGPHPGFRGCVTVFGQDDRGCWQGNEIDVPEIPRGACWQWDYELTISSIDPRSVHRL